MNILNIQSVIYKIMWEYRIEIISDIELLIWTNKFI